MNKKHVSILLSVILILGSVLAILVSMYLNIEKEEIIIEPESKTEAIMLLIEFEGTEGLVNFVDQIKQRDIPGLLVVRAEFIEENCGLINVLLDYHDIEIAGSAPGLPLWDVSYEEQFEIIRDVKDRIFQCTGREIRVFSSRYFAYDENTLKATQENNIGYVLARGTTGAKSTIYQPEEYDVKIFSVSNVDSENWGTGSLCDYSYWAREGTTVDFEKELFGALKYEKISPVSHTYIGGLKKAWNDVYIKFFDESDIKWLDLDSFGKVDITLPFADIPSNREVQYDTPHPAIPLEEEENIDNPCSITDISERVTSSPTEVREDLVIFHNGSGAMCLDALGFFEASGYGYVEYINTDSEYETKYGEYRAGFNVSEGISTNFGYYPIIFVKDRVFSGFNNDIKTEIELLMR